MCGHFLAVLRLSTPSPPDQSAMGGDFYPLDWIWLGGDWWGGTKLKWGGIFWQCLWIQRVPPQQGKPWTWYMSCEIMLILTVRPLAFQGYTILHITYLKKFQKLEFFEKNRKKSRNSRFLLMTIFSMLFANSFNSQGHLIAKKKICGRGYIITCAAFFSFWEKMILSTQTCCE